MADDDDDDDDRPWVVRPGKKLNKQARKYVKDNGITLADLVRRLVALWTNPEDPRPAPPASEHDKRRVKRTKKR